MVGAAVGGVMQRQNQNQVQKSIFLRQKSTRAGRNGSAQHSGWEQRQGSITGPLLLTETPLTWWCIEFISASLAWALCCAKPVQDRSSPRAVLTYSCYQESQAAENSNQPNPFFWATVKAWRGNLYWRCAVREIPFGFVLL